jgi:hypothetical protein
MPLFDDPFNGAQAEGDLTVPRDAAPLGGAPPAAPANLPPPYQAPQTGIGRALAVALPAIAAAVAMKRGTGLSEFASGFVGTQDRMAQRQLQQETLRRSIAAQASAEAHQKRLEAMEQARMGLDTARTVAAQQDRQDAETRAVIESYVNRNAQDPNWIKTVNEAGPENFGITVPHFGNINLRAAMDYIGVPKDPKGQYQIGGKPEPLVPVPGTNGKPVYGTAKAGDPVYEKPEKPSEASYTYKDIFDPKTNTFVKTVAINNKNPADVRDVTSALGGTTRANPGAGAASVMTRASARATRAVDDFESTVNEADKLGVVGALSGRTFQEFLSGKVGTTGDPKKDAVITELKGDMLRAKVTLDGMLGGTKGASSALLAKMWNDVISSHMTKAGFEGAIRSMRKFANEDNPQGNGVNGYKVGDTYNGRKIVAAEPVVE